MRSGHPDRTAGVRADADNGEVRSERRAGAPGGTPGGIRGVIGIAGKAGQDGIDAVAAAFGKFGERGLGEDDTAGSLDLCDHGRVSRRIVLFPSLEARSHWHADRVEIVFDNYGDAVQWTDECP